MLGTLCVKVAKPPPHPSPGFKTQDVNISPELRNFKHLIIILCVLIYVFPKEYKGSDGWAQAVLRDLDSWAGFKISIVINFLFIELTPQLKLDFNSFEMILHSR